MTIIDTNVFTQIAKGNVQAAEALVRLIRSSSRKMYIARASYNELVFGSPTQELREGYRTIINDLKLKVAPPGAMADRVDFYDNNMNYEPGPNQPGRVKEYGNGIAKERPGDAFVAAEARSLNTDLWTLDAPLARRAANQGVAIARESAIPYVQGVENIGLARRLLKLRPRINLKIPDLPNIKVKLSSLKLGIRSGLRVQLLRGLGIAVLETFIFAVIAAILDGWLQKKYIKEGLELVAEYINDKLPELALDIAKLQLRLEDGEKVYLVYHVEIHIKCTADSHKWPAYPDKYREVQIIQGRDSASVWLADFTGLQISTKFQESNSSEELGPWGVRGRIEHFIRSVEVAVFTKEELDAYNECCAAYLGLKRKLGMDPTNRVWNEELHALRAQLVAAFGEDLWFLETETLAD